MSNRESLPFKAAGLRPRSNVNESRDNMNSSELLNTQIDQYLKLEEISMTEAY